MKHNTPKVSVIMPVYNTKEEYLREAIESILNQTFKDFELIIVNDGSTNNAEEVIKSYKDKRIRYYKNETNIGIPKTRNRLLSLATGQFIANMDSDDISLPERLKTQVDYLENNPNVSIIGSWFELFPNNLTIKHVEHPKYLDLLKGCCIGNPTAMFRKNEMKKYNLHYNEDFANAEDYDLWSRAIRYLEVYNIPQVLLMYRWHETNVSKTKKDLTSAGDARIKQDMLDFLTDDKKLQEQIKHICCTKQKNTLLENIFSIKNSQNKRHKIVTVFGIKVKIKVKRKKINNNNWLPLNSSSGSLYSLVSNITELTMLKTKYCWNNIKIPKMKNSWDTIKKLLNSNESLIRFGDGEFLIMEGHSICFQKYDYRIKNILKEIFFKENPNLLIGLPELYYQYPMQLEEQPKQFILNWLPKWHEIILKYYNPQKIYYSSFISLTFSQLEEYDFEKHYNSLKQIWNDKAITIITGDRVYKNIKYNIFENASSINYIYGPTENAFDAYNELHEKCLNEPIKNILIFAMGPTGKCLAYEMYKKGYRVLDLGHIIKDYDFYKKSTKMTGKQIDGYRSTFFNKD